MDIFRMGHDSYGEAMAKGLSLELLPVVFWAAVAIIVVHLVYSALTRRNRGG